ncbi:MAG: hypothetical protein IPL61_39570 [Myxococcales bacterium]|nr:hypothetical protein [Myxococcales bacterium]
MSAAVILVTAALGGSVARADLPDKNKDREGWIKASMTGPQAAFCASIEPKKLTGGADPDFVANQVASQWDGVAPAEATLDTALFLANALCKFPGNPPLQQKLLPLWQSFLTFYGLGKADLADFAILANPDRARIDTPTKAPKDARLGELAGRMQALAASEQIETSYGMDFMSYAQLLDTTAAPSEHLKVAFVTLCVDGYHGSIARWAICKADAQALDRARFDQELAGPTVDPRHRLEAKMNFVRLQRAVAAQAKKFADEAAKDDGVAKVIDALPAAATKAWADERGTYADALAWAGKLVDDARANNKKLMAGCEEQLVTHLATYLKARAPRTVDDLKDVFKDNVGSQLAAAAAVCFVRNDAARKFWSDWSTGYAQHWGVRTQIWYALASEKIEFDTDRGNDPLGLPKPVVLYANTSAAGSMGTIATMKANGDAFDITFKKETWKETVCKQWKETNKVSGIDLKTGKLIYRGYCAKTGTETRSSTATPVSVPTAYAAGLKVGVPARFARNDDGTAYPTAIYGDKKRTKLIGAFGALY